YGPLGQWPTATALPRGRTGFDSGWGKGKLRFRFSLAPERRWLARRPVTAEVGGSNSVRVADRGLCRKGRTLSHRSLVAFSLPPLMPQLLPASSHPFCYNG